jgi:HK97 family phage major capsid protein
MAEEFKDAAAAVMTAFESYKATNDAALAEIKAKGVADPVVTEKLSKIETTLSAYEGLNQKVTQAEAKAKAMDELQANFDRLEAAVKRVGLSDDGGEKKDRVGAWARAVVNAQTKGVLNLEPEEQKVLADITAEYKSLSVSTDTAGGYLAPRELVLEIIKAETLMSPVRSLARVRQTAMKAVNVPKRTGQFAAVWVAEQGTKTETTGLTYGLEEIPTHEFYALVDISNQMLEDSAFDMQAEISTESSEQFAVAEGAAFVSGNAVGKPEGFMTNTSVATTVSGSALVVTADGMLTLKHAIKSAYAANATWAMNRTTLGSVRKLKDGQGNYLWMPGIALGKPNTLDGDPYVEVPDMPLEGAGLKPIAYGDFRRAYLWIDRIQMEMLRDPYTQATAGNVRFVMRKRVGGQVVLAEAIRTLTCST